MHRKIVALVKKGLFNPAAQEPSEPSVHEPERPSHLPLPPTDWARLGNQHWPEALDAHVQSVEN